MRPASAISFIVLVILTGIFCINACKKTDYKRYPAPTARSFSIPEGFPEPAYSFQNNPLTEQGFALGKKLFHDHLLSRNADVNCSSCHQQHAAYTTFDHDLGHGTNHQHTERNVPVIFNIAWHSEFEWDGRIKKLEDQPRACMTAPEKMGEEINNVVNKLNADTEYKRMFGEAFGDDHITGERVSLALTQFIASIISSGSKYDKVKKGDAAFNASEQNGYQLFRDKCATCHTEPLFTDLSFRNNGLELNPSHNDLGRMAVTGNRSDSLKFKVPTLRNIALTGYFTHDGRFIALSEMLNHYSEGIHSSPTLDPLLTEKLPMTELEKFYLREFLNTLTDSTLISDQRFAE